MPTTSNKMRRTGETATRAFGATKIPTIGRFAAALCAAT